MLLPLLVVWADTVRTVDVDSQLLDPGYGIYLPYTSVFTPGMLGTKIFHEVPRKCITYNSNVGKNLVESYSFPKPSSFYRFLEEKVDLKGDTPLYLNFYKSLLDASTSIDNELKVC